MATTSPSSPSLRPRRSMSWKAPLIIFSALTAGALGTGLLLARPSGIQTIDAFLNPTEYRGPRYTAARTKLPITVEARGDLESGRSLDVVSRVEGQNRIIFIQPEGTWVKKGDLVCELDSSALRNNLLNQEIQTKTAAANYQSAVENRKIAEISVEEYISGTYPQSEQSITNAVVVATTEFANAIDRMKWSNRMLQIGYVTSSQNLADRLSLQRAKLSLSESQTRLWVLREYGRRKRIIELQAAVDRARSEELAKETSYRLEEAKEEKLRDQIEKCRMFAPGDGLVVYSNQNAMRSGSSQTPIEEGATVRERQRILSLPDISTMRVNAKIHESEVDSIRPGQKARIKVDAYPNLTLEGTVDSMKPLADPTGGGRGMPDSEVKYYTTIVAINNPPSSLRPGMTGKVEILCQQTEDILAIPVQAVLQFQGKSHVFVTTPRGPELREVKLGITNAKLIEVEDGLREGDEVALQPLALMNDMERRKAFTVACLDSPEDDWSEILASASHGESPGMLPGSP